MKENIMLFIALLPLLLLLSVIIITSNTNWMIKIGKYVLGLAILLAMSIGIFIIYDGQFQNYTFGLQRGSLGILFRIDSLSMAMFLMVSIIGFVVLRFSKNYLEGDSNQIIFIRRLLNTIALVQLLVISGSLTMLFIAWVSTSISLQSLIAFYKERKRVQNATMKKFIAARISDLSLLLGLVFLYFEFGTDNLNIIFNGLKDIQPNQVSYTLELSALFLALAAIIKAVQIPFHGWILDVMEAPTPVSALLHAGLLNAGPFLIIRFALLMDVVTIGPILLLTVGGISALYGTLIAPYQPSIKTGLAYSSIGHMGFSLMICGMGLYSASLLHLIAHSFYKAHSFLSSGSAVDKHRLELAKGTVRFKTSVWSIITGAVISVLLFVLIAQLWGGLYDLPFQFLVLGTIMILGVTSYIAKFTAFENGFIIIIKSTITSGVVLLSFFTLEAVVRDFIDTQLPVVSSSSVLVNGFSLMLLLLFVFTVFSPMIDKKIIKVSKNQWETYRRNGFYIHIIFDRFINSMYLKMTK